MYIHICNSYILSISGHRQGRERLHHGGRAQEPRQHGLRQDRGPHGQARQAAEIDTLIKQLYLNNFESTEFGKSKGENSRSISCSFRDGDGKITLSEFRELFKK